MMRWFSSSGFSFSLFWKLSRKGNTKSYFLDICKWTSLLISSQAVKRFMTLQCKCHGVSGSCSVRTCWQAMADFRRTGDHLRRRYNGAVQVAVNQYGTGFTAAHTHLKRPSKNDLVYLEDSPDYCIRDPQSGKGLICPSGHVHAPK